MAKGDKRRSATTTGPTHIGLVANRRNRKPTVTDDAGKTPDVLQYELWSTFWSSEAGNLSNTVELWDAIPKFGVHRNKQIELRDPEGRLPLYRTAFRYRDEQCQLEIQPAMVHEDGRDIAYYPAGDEELVWEALVKLFSDQQYGFHDAKESPPSSYVRFTLRMLQKELSEHGHARSIPQIRHAVEILSRSVIIIYKGSSKKPIYRDVILGGLIDMTRDDYLDDPKRFWIGRLPGMISAALSKLEYRQYNYQTSLSLKDPFARWLHRRMTHRFTNAQLMGSYHLALSTMQEDSALLDGDNITRIVKRVDACFRELKKNGVLSTVEKEIHRDTGRGRKILDVVWTVYPLPDFVRDIKAANGRLKDSNLRLSLVGSRPEHNTKLTK